MNVAGWMREVRRLLAALHPDAAYRNGEITLTHHAERPSPKPKAPPVAAHWRASCGIASHEAPTPEEAAAGVISKLEKQLADQIESHRAALERLEKAASGGLRLVREEKPS